MEGGNGSFVGGVLFSYQKMIFTKRYLCNWNIDWQLILGEICFIVISLTFSIKKFGG